MDTFVFRYERILRLRMDEEEQCKNQLAQRIKQHLELEAQLQALLERQEAYRRSVEVKVAEGCTVQTLREAEAERKWLNEAIENQRFLIQLKEREILDARLKLGEASKKRKIMEKLKENDFIEFQKEAESREEQVTDQIVTFRGAHRGNR